ncbi:MAG: hypothetical protein LBQ52_05430 [Helicobacteraceae bacterium]|jgi:hypothetical protein|nr:hypothetical protein [Helicobacteraceae bacterium]
MKTDLDLSTYNHYGDNLIATAVGEEEIIDLVRKEWAESEADSTDGLWAFEKATGVVFYRWGDCDFRSSPVPNLRARDERFRINTPLEQLSEEELENLVGYESYSCLSREARAVLCDGGSHKEILVAEAKYLQWAFASCATEAEAAV